MGFQTTYEELKQYLPSCTYKHKSLPDYLWGIETEEMVGHSIIPDLLPDYLWGIETRHLPVVHSVFIASRLPMRNWNPPTTKPVRSFQTSFQTTYEELKLSFYISSFVNLKYTLPDYLWGIETSIWWRRRESNPRFQTTYEELKLWSIFQVRYFHFLASRLPMRNWNYPTRTLRAGDESLPDYLWGIETYQSVVDCRWHISASRLPMRNWNFEAWSEGSEGSCFQTTYEELKHVNVGGQERLWRTPGFQTTYEELKLFLLTINH